MKCGGICDWFSYCSCQSWLPRSCSPGLSMMRDHLASWDEPSSYEDLVSLSLRIDNHLREREAKKNYKSQRTFFRSSNSSFHVTTPSVTFHLISSPHHYWTAFRAHADWSLMFDGIGEGDVLSFYRMLILWLSRLLNCLLPGLAKRLSPNLPSCRDTGGQIPDLL